MTDPAKTDPQPRPSVPRRTFLAGAAAASGLMIVPRHVLGGPAQVPPSEKLTVALIGCGTQGLSELMGMLATPELQIVAVCDPNQDMKSDSNTKVSGGHSRACNAWVHCRQQRRSKKDVFEWRSWVLWMQPGQ